MLLLIIPVKMLYPLNSIMVLLEHFKDNICFVKLLNNSLLLMTWTIAQEL